MSEETPVYKDGVWHYRGRKYMRNPSVIDRCKHGIPTDLACEFCNRPEVKYE